MGFLHIGQRIGCKREGEGGLARLPLARLGDFTDAVPPRLFFFGLPDRLRGAAFLVTTLPCDPAWRFAWWDKGCRLRKSTGSRNPR